MLATLACAAPAAAADNGGVIVRYRPGTGAAARLDTRRDADVTRDAGMLLPRAEVVDPAAGQSVADAVKALEADPDVAFAEPNGRRHALATPSDPLFGQQWGLGNSGQSIARSDPRNVASGVAGADIHASAAWDVTTGSPGVTVAVVDSGVDFTNPDLSSAEWTNPGETGTDAQGRDRSTNGADDDGDGFVDDVHGWDFVDSDKAPADLNGHGTHVSGIIGARGGDDGFGVTGVNWHSTVMAVRVLDPLGSGADADVVNGEIYAANRGARVVNMSFGATTPLQSELDAIKSHPDTLFVVAAGNDSANNDAVGDFPCNYALPNILCVAASDRTDNLAWFSDFGASTVDLAAPGEDIVSTWPASIPPTSPVVLGDNRWALESGTSMATPMVAGVAGLVLAHHATLTEAQLRQSITDGVDRLPAFTGNTVTGGRLDAAGALAASDRLFSPPPPPPPPPPAPAPVKIASTAPTADLLAPVLSLTVARTGSLRTALRRGLSVRARCSEGCTLSYALLLDAATARRFHVRRTIARDSGRAARSATDLGLLRLKLPKRARRSHRLRLTLRVRARDTAGNAVTRTATIVLR